MASHKARNNPLLSLLSMPSVATSSCINVQPPSPEGYLAKMMGDMHAVYFSPEATGQQMNAASALQHSSTADSEFSIQPGALDVENSCPLEPPPALPPCLHAAGSTASEVRDKTEVSEINHHAASSPLSIHPTFSAPLPSSSFSRADVMARLPQHIPPSRSNTSNDILDNYYDDKEPAIDGSGSIRSGSSQDIVHLDSAIPPRRASHDTAESTASSTLAATRERLSRKNSGGYRSQPASPGGITSFDTASENNVAENKVFDVLDFSTLDEIYGFYAETPANNGSNDSLANASMSANDSMSRNRSKAAQEVVSTEITYVEMLTVLIECIIVPLREQCKKLGSRKMPVDDLQTLFGNVEEILNLHRILLTALQERYTMWTEEQKISDIFISMVPFFKMYIQYMANYSSAVETLTRCRKSYPEFAKFIDNAQLSPRFKGLQLLSLMIMPIQRVPRYIMLLKQLLQFTKPTHPDFTGLENCLSEMRSIADHINESIRDFESQKKVMEIQSKLSSRPSSLGALIMPSRFFVAQLEVHKPGNTLSKRTIFLLNDLAILAKRINDDKYEYKDEMPLNSRGWVQQLYEDPREFIFHMVTPEKSWSLVASTFEEQDSYCALIEAAMNGRAGKRSSGISLATPNGSSTSLSSSFNTGMTPSSYHSGTIPARGGSGHHFMGVNRKQYSMTGMSSAAAAEAGVGIHGGSGAGAAMASNSSRLSNISLSGSTNSPTRLSGSFSSPPPLNAEPKRRSSSSNTSTMLGSSSSMGITTPSSSASTLPVARGSRTSLPPPQRKESIPHLSVSYEDGENANAHFHGQIGTRPRSESGTRSSSRSSRE